MKIVFSEIETTLETAKVPLNYDVSNNSAKPPGHAPTKISQTPHERFGDSYKV